MRCVVCGCDKPPAAFSGAQKKRSAAKRKCAMCTAANNSNAGIASPSAASHATDIALLKAAPGTATTTTPVGLTAAAVEVTSHVHGIG